MANSDLYAFCDTKFWDINVTWNTQIPDFTLCFQSTVLELVPCICFWLVAVINIWHTSKLVSRPPLPWTLLLVIKLVFTVILTLLSVIDLAFLSYSIYIGESVSDAELCVSCVKTVTFIFIITMILQHRKSGITSSSALSVFWLVLSLCGAILYRSSFIRLYYGGYLLTREYKFTSDMCYYPLVFLQFVLFLFADTKDYEKVKRPLLLEEVPFFCFFTFHWVNGLVFKSLKKLLTVEDLPPLIPQLLAYNVWTKFIAVWRKIVERCSEGRTHSKSGELQLPRQWLFSNGSLMSALIKSFWPWLLIAVILELILDVMRFFPALILNLLIEFASNDEMTWRGYFYCILLFTSSITEKLIFNILIYYSISGAIQFKAALSSEVYRKALRLSNDSRKRYTVGELVSLMAVDIDKVYNFSQFFTAIFGAPLKIIFTIALLWQYLGPSCLAGVAVIIAVIPVTLYAMHIYNTVQYKQMETKDLRLKHMNELLNGIKVLKLCAWEIPFMKNIEKIRLKEVKLIRIFQLCYAVFCFVWCCSPFFVAVVSFSTFVLVSKDNILDPSTAFVSLSLLNLLRFALFEVPDILSELIQTNISLGRLRLFLTSKERDEFTVGKSPDKGEAITVREASFSWESESEPTLKNIDLHIPVGSLVAVVGSVGSGKSSLLSAMLGHMNKCSGSVDLVGKIAYVPQQAWILNETLKQNILFLKAFEEKKYNSVLTNCCLKPDLELLPGGELTEIGEKGVNLSGGQKQRVSLARAVYQNSDVYLLDDPLSAVDAHVGKHLFDHVLGPKGMLRRKTRVLVTHSIAVLPEVDFIVSVKDGQIDETGTYKELIAQNGSFASFIKEHQQTNEETEDGDIISPQLEIEPFGFVRSVSSVQRSISSQSLPSVVRMSSVESNKKSFQRLIEDEGMEVGKVKTTVYINYMRHANLKFVFGILLGYLSYQSLEISGNIWLSEWSSDPILPDGTQDTSLRNLRIGVYAVFGIMQACSILFASLNLAFGSASASRIYHNKMLKSVMRAPMSFFDTTPLGRIINRFGKDMDVVDSEIPAELDGWLSCALGVLATCIVIGMNTPTFLVALIPLGICYYIIQRLYLSAARQIKRLNSITRSPVYSHFSETMQGVSSVKAYRAEEEFIKAFEAIVDTNISTYYYWICSNRWLGVRLDILGNMIVLAASILTVASRGTIDGAIVGLSLTYALSITDAMLWLVRTGTELENQLVSVERIEEYLQLPPEAPWDIDETRPPCEWPTKGTVSFRNYSTRYRENLDLVLKNIDLDISPNEKVGIVGRTGAGKSSITLALFRIIEAVGGNIIIDDVDVSEIGLHDLRSRLTIIPQDPVLFTGTLRVNLDPNNEHADDELWESLEHAHLKNFVTTLAEGLNFDILEGGENLSVGQRQLLCLARALLKKTKILVLDEATAAVDMETDSLIQNTIRQEFEKYTVITIAHRLHTIMDYDKVVVMDAGKVIEVGKPSELVKKPGSSFHSLAKNAGLA